MEVKDWSTFADAVWERKVPFLVVFAGIFAATYGALFAIDFIPEPPKDEAMAASSSVAAVPAPRDLETPREPSVLRKDALPNSIIIDKLDREITVENPTSRAIPDLDEALLAGVVRHPDSATFTNEGNIFILGHSSYLPNVRNQNFQAFNGIQNLEWGDTIRLRSNDTEYVYRVERVYEARASEVVIPIADTGPRLTLATCDSFASKDDRFIVESKLVETRPLLVS